MEIGGGSSKLMREIGLVSQTDGLPCRARIQVSRQTLCAANQRPLAIGLVDMVRQLRMKNATLPAPANRTYFDFLRLERGPSILCTGRLHSRTSYWLARAKRNCRGDVLGATEVLEERVGDQN